MFGPDRCGATNKVHFILQHKLGSSEFLGLPSSSHVRLKIFNDSLFFVRQVPDHLLKVFKFYFGWRFVSMVMDGASFQNKIFNWW